MKKVLLLAGLAGMVAANAEAIDVTPYVGLDANYAMVDTDSSHSISSKDWSLSGVIGGRTDRFGLEAFYNYGLKEHKSSHDTRISGYGLDAIVYQQLGCSGRWELLGSAGIANYKIKGNNGLGTDYGMAERLGAGLQYAMTENASARVMYHHAWVNGSKLDSLDEISLGIRYAF